MDNQGRKGEITMTDQELMEKVQAIRDKTKLYTWVQISYDAFRSGKAQIEYQYGSEHNIKSFPTREALVAHLDGILNNLRPKD